VPPGVGRQAPDVSKGGRMSLRRTTCREYLFDVLVGLMPDACLLLECQTRLDARGDGVALLTRDGNVQRCAALCGLVRVPVGAAVEGVLAAVVECPEGVLGVERVVMRAGDELVAATDQQDPVVQEQPDGRGERILEGFGVRVRAGVTIGSIDPDQDV